MDNGGTYTLIHFTDVHAVADGLLLKDHVDTVGTLATGLAAVVASGRAIDAIVVSGDIADDGDDASYRRVADLLEPTARELGAAVVVAMGNHDLRSSLREGLAGEEPGTGSYDHAVRFGGLRVITLDSTVPGEAHGELEDGQLDWLRRELATAAPDGSLLVLHHPPIPSALPMMNAIGLREPERLAEVLAGSDVRLVLAGHTHSATAGSVAGIPVWVGPASAYALDPLPPAGTVRGLAFHAYTLVEIFAGSVMTTQVPIVGPKMETIYQTAAESAEMLATDEA
jgi:3',5'-cyclic-AMP phosphodiesterase